MDEQGNTDKAKSVAKAVDRQKRPDKLQKFAKEFVNDDISHVKSYLAENVLIPAIKDTLSKLVKNAIDLILYGKAGNNSQNSRDLRPSYREYYDNKNGARSSYVSRPFAFEDCYYETREEAEAVLEQMTDILNRNGFVRVGDYYDLSDKPTRYTDYNYGWRTLANATPVIDGDYWTLRLPRPTPYKM